MSDNTLRTGDWSDIVVALLTAALLYVVLIWLAFKFSCCASAEALILAAAVGASAGWIAGILASPYNDNEKGVFAEFGKLVYGFLSGYVLSKLDPIFRQALEPTTGAGPNTGTTLIVAYSVSSFLIAVALTYITRSYWIGSGVTASNR